MKTMKKYLFFAAAITVMASCTSDTLVNGDSEYLVNGGDANQIVFSTSTAGQTRGDIAGSAAATLLGNNFYVTGTKGTEQSYYPTPTGVFDNYLVHFGVNTAGTTESNTANWEYVGIDQNASPSPLPANYNRVKLSSINGAQTIKYWDYSAAQYDFFGFSTGIKKAVAKTAFTGSTDVAVQDDEIGVTAMLYGSDLNVESTIPTAYTFYIPTLEGLENTFITDITEVAPSNYGKEVTLKFKNLGSKIRVALYETVPGYSVKDVKFYKVDKADASVDDLGSGTVTTANLIGANNLSFPTKGTVNVRFEHVGNTHDSKQDYDKASAQVTPVDGTYAIFKDFGALTDQLMAKERDEVKADGSAEDGKVFVARTLPTATFAGDKDDKFYQIVFPNTSGYPVTLRVDYTLVPIDGAAETIVVKGAKAVVPSTYTRWLPNYAYTYIFKISDNTNGWTGATNKPSGLFPITFDAVVTEATDATTEQRTVTTVSTPTITTYQQYHDKSKDEYSKSVKDLDGNSVDRDIYVQVMNNKVSPATLYEDLNGTAPDGGSGTARSLLYAITGTAPISEATVMDALENQSDVDAGEITGRNGMILTPHAGKIDATVASIVNGVDNNAIDITAGQAAQIDMSAVAAGTYAYVYDYSTAAKVVKTIYQPIATEEDVTVVEGLKYISTATLDGISATTAADEAVNDAYIYFSKTNQTTVNPSVPTYSYTYSFVSVDGKTTLPAGLIKVEKSSLATAGSSAKAADKTFYFTIYNRNDGKYAVKVIKIVA